MKRIILDANQARHLQEHGKLRVSLPVDCPPPDTDPPTDWAWMREEGTGLWYAYDSEYPGEGHYDTYIPPWQPGGELWVAERWGAALGPYGESRVYLLEEEHGEPGGPYEPAETMPQEASRTTLRVVSVRPRPARFAFSDDWNKRHPAHPFGTSWAWSADLEVSGDRRKRPIHT